MTKWNVPLKFVFNQEKMKNFKVLLLIHLKNAFYFFLIYLYQDGQIGWSCIPTNKKIGSKNNMLMFPLDYENFISECSKSPKSNILEC